MPFTDRLPRPGPTLTVAGLIVTAAVIGLAVTRDARFGLMAAGGLVFVTLLVVDRPIAVGLWIVALYLAGVPGTHGAPTGATVFLVAGWIATFAYRRRIRPTPKLVHWAYASAALMLVWSGTTMLWAPDPTVGQEYVRYLVIAALALPIVVAACQSIRDVLVLAASFVLGATTLVVAGLLTGSAAAPDSPAAAAEMAAGRLHAGITDPNYLAADIVAALALVAGLLGVRELRRWRPVLLLTVPVLLYGLVATQSRGGFVAAIAAVVLAAVLLRGYRRQILAGVTGAIGLLAVFLATQPRALERLTQDDKTGTGRTEIWRIAKPVISDHFFGGVGTGNFRLVEGTYLNRSGLIEYPTFYVDTPLVAHNIWIQALVENGLVGLVFQISLIVTCIAASFVAARWFDRAGRSDLANLGRALAVGQLGSVVASTFLSNGDDRVFWVLLALGPALLMAASRLPRLVPPVPRPPRSGP